MPEILERTLARGINGKLLKIEARLVLFRQGELSYFDSNLCIKSFVIESSASESIKQWLATWEVA